MSFDYAKSDVDVTKRDVVVLKEPTNMTLGYDVSSLEETNQVNVALEMSKALDEYNSKITEIAKKWDISSNLRRFDRLKMRNVSENYYG